VQALDDHDHQRLQEKPLGVKEGPPTRRARRRRGGDALHQTEESDKDAILSDHKRASEERVYGCKPSSEAFRVQASLETLSYL
jgi:hypothetical protein